MDGGRRTNWLEEKSLKRTEMKITYIDIGLHKEAKEIGMMLRVLKRIRANTGKDIELEIFGYEAHPSYVQRLKMLYADEHPYIHIQQAAICDQEGSVNLYLSPSTDGEGNSIHSTKNNVIGTSIEVPARRLSDELMEIVKQGKMGDILIVRFNIEGAELEMMEDLIRSDAHELIDLYCGAPSDIPKVGAIKHLHQQYQDLLAGAGIQFQRFHAHYDSAVQAVMELRMENWIRDRLDTSSSHTSTGEHSRT